jgi:hypothetical protein
MARVTVIFRDARREDVPVIVAMLADDFLGADREAAHEADGGEAAVDDAYFAAFDQIESDPRNRLIVAESGGRVAGTLQLTLLPGLSRLRPGPADLRQAPRRRDPLLSVPRLRALPRRPEALVVTTLHHLLAHGAPK